MRNIVHVCGWWVSVFSRDAHCHQQQLVQSIPLLTSGNAAAPALSSEGWGRRREGVAPRPDSNRGLLRCTWTKRLRRGGHRIRELRTAAGLSQDQLADRIHMERRSVQRYERGERDPRFTDLVLIADALGVTVAELVR
ncbi:helix-turn-helix domain-containing protein [Streptomyces venezuelae]|uniref:helix-turn-helix domain-containing protein n=2 Tax=Streptomyces TaxID=1883 RepID=UPI000998DE97|nr:helix-turn-helix transcriptional regulator [Streptomyces venezuelae]QER99551.1 XRE family transcriptional regulator [Streptomyces venezuelae ATCC 10712]